MISPSLAIKLDLLREARNKIHLGKLTLLDDGYSKEMVEQMFKTVKELKKAGVHFLVHKYRFSQHTFLLPK